MYRRQISCAFLPFRLSKTLWVVRNDEPCFTFFVPSSPHQIPKVIREKVHGRPLLFLERDSHKDHVSKCCPKLNMTRFIKPHDAIACSLLAPSREDKRRTSHRLLFHCVDLLQPSKKWSYGVICSSFPQDSVGACRIAHQCARCVATLFSKNFKEAAHGGPEFRLWYTDLRPHSSTVLLDVLSLLFWSQGYKLFLRRLLSVFYDLCTDMKFFYRKRRT